MIAGRWALWWSTLVAVLVLDLPGPEPQVAVASAIGLALALGGLAFAALAGSQGLPLVPPRGRWGSAARLSVHFTSRAAFEEALWRGLALGWLTALLGPAAGLALSTGGFAASHVAAQGRLAAAHLLTGTAFGGVYLATGHLLAAVLAHATYDVLVTLAVLSQRTWPLRPIVGRGPPLYDRPTEGLP